MNARTHVTVTLTAAEADALWSLATWVRPEATLIDAKPVRAAHRALDKLRFARLGLTFATINHQAKDTTK